jgi:formate hydrogenlyase transcriptional activator
MSDSEDIPSRSSLRGQSIYPAFGGEHRDFSSSSDLDTLHFITEGTVQFIGENFFRQLARHVADALRVRYCFLTECTDDSQTRVRALAFWNGEGFAQNVAYPLRGTPCEEVIEGNICAYPERLQLLFPEDKDLVALGAESYAGIPLPNSEGRVLGHMVVMDTQPRVFGEKELRILKIFATRAGVELERTRADAALKKSENRLRALLEINNAIIAKLNRDELFTAIADALAQIIWFDRLALSLHDPGANVLRILSYAGTYQRADYTPVGRVLQLDDSPAGQAFTQQKAVVRPNLEAERLTSSEQRAFAHGFRSMCALPLIVRGKSIGAITLGSLTPLQYLKSGEDFLVGVANQVALAIDNMTAHEETEKLKARFEAEAVYLQEEIKTEHNFEEIIGQSAPVRGLLRQLEHVAPTDSTVLIRGETGTGKELIARAVHDRSRRKDRPLVKVNCGSIPSGLVESELFGHEKGAFTGATQRRIGRFELADGGTIFLDEVTELPLDTQVKLLRVLQEGEFERVGSSQSIKVNARVIAATNRDLKEVVGNGSFRSDLFYRLNVFPLEVPPLRERREDIPLLVNFFLSGFGKKLGKEMRGMAQRSMESLIRYNWPGNIRELQNVIERAAVLAKGPIVQVDDSLLRADDVVEGPSILDTLENVERAHIIRALNETKWVIHGKKGAAEILGINPSTLRSRMEKLAIKRQA